MEEKCGHSSAHSTAHRSSQDQECSKHASSEHQEEGAVAVIGRLREPGQESLRPQREETICPALQLVFFPSLGSPAGCSCPLAELSGSQRTRGPSRQPQCRGEGQMGDVWGLSEVGPLLPDSASTSRELTRL